MLHIGGDIVLPEKDVIAILDYKKSGIDIKSSAGQILGEGKIRSVILAEEEGRMKTYFSPLAVSYLCRLKDFGGN